MFLHSPQNRVGYNDSCVLGWNPASNLEAGGHDLEGEGTGGDDAFSLYGDRQPALVRRDDFKLGFE